mmetsp:Transcript_27882/g.34418  ORF Transcript_27882/g.34418 Transcript_27882/m.34418 type:complete len:192 (+) Transcript_27882:40-615(+)
MKSTTLQTIFLFICLGNIPSTQSYGSPDTSRGDFFKTICKAAGSSLIVSQTLLPLHTNLMNDVANAVAIEKAESNIRRAGGTCAYGVGDGCEELSGGNEFIKELQRKSAANKELAQKEYLSAYQMKNYPDFFASLSPPKFMVKKPDGTFALYEADELTELKKAGKIKIEKPMAMGGQVIDVTVKPILVLVE